MCVLSIGGFAIVPSSIGDRLPTQPNYSAGRQRRHSRSVSPNPRRLPLKTLTSYKVKVTTGNVFGAGTNANVFILFIIISAGYILVFTFTSVFALCYDSCYLFIFTLILAFFAGVYYALWFVGGLT